MGPVAVLSSGPWRCQRPRGAPCRAAVLRRGHLTIRSAVRPVPCRGPVPRRGAAPRCAGHVVIPCRAVPCRGAAPRRAAVAPCGTVEGPCRAVPPRRAAVVLRCVAVPCRAVV
eukprot:4348145-Pyramimonas_sp.AAC.1